VATRSNAWVCGLSFAGIAVSNPAVDVDVSLLWVLCVVRSLRRTDPSSSGVLPSVVCLSETSIMGGAWPNRGYCAIGNKKRIPTLNISVYVYHLVSWVRCNIFGGVMLCSILHAYLEIVLGHCFKLQLVKMWKYDCWNRWGPRVRNIIYNIWVHFFTVFVLNALINISHFRLVSVAWKMLRNGGM
jgi:hypothetical protein